VTPAIFFSLLIIAVSFLPVFGLTGRRARLFQAARLHEDVRHAVRGAAVVTVAPALRDYLHSRQDLLGGTHPVSRVIRKVYEPFVHVALHNPKTTVLIGVMALCRRCPRAAARLGVHAAARRGRPPLHAHDLPEHLHRGSEAAAPAAGRGAA
jgi:Cu(I)/Ag(I) efflux system membrane protein CusA/SilA